MRPVWGKERGGSLTRPHTVVCVAVGAGLRPAPDKGWIYWPGRVPTTLNVFKMWSSASRSASVTACTRTMTE